MTTILTPDYEDSIWPSVSIVDIKAITGIALSSGCSLRGRFPEGLEISQRDSIVPPDFFFAGPMPIVSQYLAETISNLNFQFELFELGTSNLAGKGKYYFWNLIESVDRFDWKQSVFLERGGFATDIRSLRLCGINFEPPIYRIAKTIPSLIALSEQATQMFLKSRLTGFHLVKVESWINPAKNA